MQLAWANELLETHLAGASQELLQISSGTGADSASQDLKLQLDGLVKRITACFVGVQSCIPESPSPATSRPAHGTPLTTPAQVLPDCQALSPSSACSFPFIGATLARHSASRRRGYSQEPDAYRFPLLFFLLCHRLAAEWVEGRMKVEGLQLLHTAQVSLEI